MRTLALAVGLVLAACASEAPPDPGVITVALANAPTNLDPRVGSDEASQRVHQLLYNCLFRVGDDLRVVPELASGLERPDPRTYVVRLRPGVRFHNGQPLTAADVVFTFRSFLDPSFVSPRKGAYRLLDGSSIRTPSFGVYTAKGENFENYGVQPDVLVDVRLQPEARVLGQAVALE